MVHAHEVIKSVVMLGAWFDWPCVCAIRSTNVRGGPQLAAGHISNALTVDMNI
jgi:hypothetical protein